MIYELILPISIDNIQYTTIRVSSLCILFSYLHVKYNGVIIRAQVDTVWRCCHRLFFNESPLPPPTKIVCLAGSKLYYNIIIFLLEYDVYYNTF